MNYFRNVLDRLRRDEGGAVLLLSLASILIIMMLSWVIIDAGKSARDKIELQASADAAAFSQASVKSRTMNMIAYTNVAKRSVIGITALYRAMWDGYSLWLLARWGQCGLKNLKACWDALDNTLFVWIPELLGDWRQYAGLSLPFGSLLCGFKIKKFKVKKTCPKLMKKFLGLNGNGSEKKYHGRDLRALDNYQRYMSLLTPWWGQAEATVRGMRNGATTAASFPAPQGEIIGPIPNLLNGLKSALGAAGLGGLFAGTNVTDELPIKRMSFDDLYDDHMMKDKAFLAEHAANILHHRNRSAKGAKKMAAILLGVGLFGSSYNVTTDAVKGFGEPWGYREFNTFGTWSSYSSNLVYTYQNRSTRFTDERQKYDFISKDYKHQLGALDQVGYKASGYWSMARAEMSYQDGRPNPFRPSWTARMRPVALPGEWQEAGYELNQTYHDILPFLALSSVVGLGSGASLMASIRDFGMMERATRGFGYSTIDGVGK